MLHDSERIHLRIIPARAGFTVCAVVVLLGLGDHPRSRGVYFRTSARRAVIGGSSPLARGLRIPSSWTPSSESDHPRSRGVYLASEPGEVLAGGIIPARAGFT